MNTNYLQVDGKYYSIDMSKVIEFISENDASTQTISQNYGIPLNDNGTIGTEIKLISKEISESKDSMATITI